jgi:hypothetical protein
VIPPSAMRSYNDGQASARSLKEQR